MKLMKKPVDAMVVFRTSEKYPRPYKFKIDENGEKVTVVVEQILDSKKIFRFGAEAIFYDCQSIINGKLRRFVLKYFCSECRWQLYKM